VSRLPPQPGEVVERDQVVTFTFDGKQVTALAGDTIGSALYAVGRRTFSRSFKYHRRRGLMCCAGHCPNCLVAVDGAPGVRACTGPVREGAKVEHLNAVPSLEYDAMAVTDAVGGPFTPPGFYYKTFVRPRRLWPLHEKLLRYAAGLGRLRKAQPERTWRTEYRRRHADVLVVGGGVAGLAAAIAAAELGADVVLADDGPEPGGRLLWEEGHEQARALAAKAREAGVEILTSAPALGDFDGLVAVWQRDTLHQIRARHHVYATGAIEQPLVFIGNDLPGVMLSGGARRLVAMCAVRPGTRAVVATTSDRGVRAALALQAANVDVAVVADLRPKPSRAAARLATNGIEAVYGWTVVAATGTKAVRGAVLAPVTSLRPGAAPAERRELECDLLVVSGGDAPATSLATQAGATTAYDERVGHFRLSELPRNVWAAGQLAGEGGHRVAETSGVLAGLVDEGYDSIELCKRYTTVTMGPCHRPGPLRGDHLRRRADPRRRHPQPDRRGELLRDDDLERRRRGRAVVLVVAGGLAHAGAPERHHPGPVRRQPRGAERALDPAAADGSRLLAGGVHVSRRQARPVLRDRQLLIMVGWALGEYLWHVVADAAEHLGGGPVGAGAIAATEVQRA
jgi:sarcosine oxidase, subunit alpha